MRNAIVVLLFCLTTNYLAAQCDNCQNQKCYRTEYHCFACNGSICTGCRVQDCNSCTWTACNGPDPAKLDWSGPDVKLFSSCRPEVVLASLQTQGAQTADNGVGVSGLIIEGSPALFLAGETTAQDLLKHGIIRNTGSKPITSYAVGWAVLMRDGHIEYARRPSKKLKDTLSPLGSTSISDSQIPSESIDKPEVKFVGIYIAQVEFSDGSRWEATDDQLRKAVEKFSQDYVVPAGI